MPLGADTDNFAGKPIHIFRIEEGIVDPDSFAYNICYEGESDGPPFWTEKWHAFLNDPRVSEVSALVIGGDLEEVMMGESCVWEIECLVSAREKLPALKSLFLGGNDTYHEAPTANDEPLLFSLPDVSLLFLAFPELEELRLYGWTQRWPHGGEFQIGTISSEKLRSLSIATAGLEARVVHDLWRAHLPALEHLELWLYDNVRIAHDLWRAHLPASELHDLDEEHAATIDDLAPLFSGKLFPCLRHLTLCMSHIEDDLAVALAASPLLERLKELDLSMGILTDRGAQALFASPALRQLEKLFIYHHYCSDEMVQQLQALPLEVEIDGQRDPNKGEPEVMEWFHV